jgi:hypothetical protein
MNYRISAAISMLAIIFGFSACAQVKKSTVKNGGSYAKVLQAIRQRTLPGAPGSTPIESFHILVTWKNTQPPATFFWRDDKGSWFECDALLVHKKAKSDADSWYTTETRSLEKVKKNDTLELTPMPGGKYPVPASIPENAANTLFFKTAKSGWMSLPVNNIKKKPDIIMP